ncbi:MAG TPA: 16S rRNA (adenine(1518)-N(6)/adenine(1519)-N(6))-dimethyltransferase RsmA [Rectinemataceae bacterium]|nr:16S rRNA (adenine(1518)-N(6)/adenine(1519)-N(6))-dimethyltransferase RsmA [Rectinemataceae bacterium]
MSNPGVPPSRPDYDSPSALSRLLDTEGLAMSKRFGQNFLVNRGAREKIVATLGAKAGERVWEIGPGIGSMTAMLLDAGLDLTAFEIDHGFARLLGRAFGEEPRFRLVEGDFLDTWKGELSSRGLPDFVFGNLPYNAAAAIIAAILESGSAVKRMVFTVQREAAQRMVAKPDSKDYSSFTVLCASTSAVRLAFDLGGGSFWPQPRVTSSVVILEALPKPLVPGDRLGFSRFVRQAFSSRRKTLRNNLKAAGWSEAAIDGVLDAEAVDRSIRAEALAPAILASLYARACAEGPGARTIEPS